MKLPTKDDVDREVANLMDNARRVEDNRTDPGEPTLSGIIAVLAREIAGLRLRVAEIEKK